MSSPLTIDVDQQALVGLGPDVEVIASQIVAAKSKLKKYAPKQVDLAAAITDIKPSDTIHGASVLTIVISDQDWVLTDSGFFDADRDGRLDLIDLNYPDGSRYWWRLMSVDFSDDTRSMQFMERMAVYLMGHHDRTKASRAKKTRAEFLAMLASRVKAGGGIDFICKELHKPQLVEGVKKKTDSGRKKLKDGGINPDAKVNVKRVKADKAQLRQAERALDVAYQLQASELAVLAMMCAAIQESLLRASSKDFDTGTHRGVFQSNQIDQNNTEEQARCFLQGEKGFGGGGAIALANAHPDWSPGKIATTVEVSGDSAHTYDQWRSEAEALVEAYGGATFGGTQYVKQYNFEIGSVDDPFENYWDGMNRIGVDEAGWRLFLDGNRMYFDSDMTLIKQKPVAVVRRGDPWVLGISDGTWDTRHIATEVSIDLICNPFEFRAGEVFQLENFGPFSTGSTAKPKALPGRWIISDISPSDVPFIQTFTLIQPTKPKREPRADTAERTDVSQVGGDIEGTPKDIIDKVALPIGSELGVRLTPTQVELANQQHTHLGASSDHAGPPGKKWAVDFGIGPDIRQGNNQSGAETGDRIAKALAEKFNIAWKGSGLAYVVKGPYRFQLIWRYEDAQAGNHYTHVHFGVKLVGSLSGDVSQSQLHKAIQKATK